MGSSKNACQKGANLCQKNTIANKNWCVRNSPICHVPDYLFCRQDKIYIFFYISVYRINIDLISRIPDRDLTLEDPKSPIGIRRESKCTVLSVSTCLPCFWVFLTALVPFVRILKLNSDCNLIIQFYLQILI